MKSAHSTVEGKLTWTLKTEFNYTGVLPSPDAECSGKVNFGINCFTQFDPLRCVIVGYIDESATSPLELIEGVSQIKYNCNKFPQEFIKRGQQDLNNLARQLGKRGIQVVRVGKKNWSQRFEVGGMKIKGYFCHSPRDVPFLYDNAMYEFPVATMNRIQEYEVFQWIEKQLFEKGSQIYYPWKSIRTIEEYKRSSEIDSYKMEDQYFGDAANLLKVGLDIIFLVSESASKGCYRIFRNFIHNKYDGRVRVHPLQDSYKGVHVDTSITLVGYNKKLQKYIAMVDGLEATTPINIPAIFRGKNWRLIQVNKYSKEFGHPDYAFVSDHMGLNFFMVNSELAIVSENQVEIRKTLEFYGVEVLPLAIKHACQFDGGFHCATNDINRDDVHGFARVLHSPRNQLTKTELSGLFDPDLLQILEQQGDIQNWTAICNQKGIFPEYLTEHLDQSEKQSLMNKHKSIIQNYLKEQQR